MEEQKNTYENVTLEPDVGFDIRFVTMDHNSPFHWHREMEILYILNGHATVHMEGEEYELNPLDAVVMDYASCRRQWESVSMCQGSFCGAICRRRNLLRSAARDSVSVQGSRNITMKSAGI